MLRLIVPNAWIRLDEKLRDEYLARASQLLIRTVIDFNQACTITIDLPKLEKQTLIVDGNLHRQISSQQSKIQDLLSFCHELSTVIDESKYFDIWYNCMYVGDIEGTVKENLWFLDKLNIPYTIMTEAQINERARKSEGRDLKYIEKLKAGNSQKKLHREQSQKYLDI
jgi:hypothetical protein